MNLADRLGVLAGYIARSTMDANVHKSYIVNYASDEILYHKATQSRKHYNSIYV